MNKNYGIRLQDGVYYTPLWRIVANCARWHELNSSEQPIEVAKAFFAEDETNYDYWVKEHIDFQRFNQFFKRLEHEVVEDEYLEAESFIF